MQKHIACELHKGIGGLFNPAMNDDGKAVIRTRALDKLKWVDAQLEGKQYLMGDAFTIADAYLFTVTNWTAHTGIDISGEMLKRAEARAAAYPGTMKLQRQDVLALDFPDAHFDQVFTSCTFCSVPRPAAEATGH